MAVATRRASAALEPDDVVIAELALNLGLDDR